MRPQQATHLLVLVGYEYERASSLIETFEPSVISLGYGRSDDSRHIDASRRFDELLLECMSKYPKVRQFAFPCNDPWECKRAILEEVGAEQGYNAVIAPLNTKISAVGCALATMEDEDIQLCYAQPLRYNYEAYSLPGDSCYSFRIPELWKEPR